MNSRHFKKCRRTYYGRPQSQKELGRFGVNRAAEKFWEKFDQFQKKFNESDPVQAGLFDLNRYHHLVQQESDSVLY